MLIGHQKQWQFLRRSKELNKLSHAYLFFGQEKLGKKTLALEFVKLLNCQNPHSTGQACGLCRPCKEIDRRESPDLLVIEPLEKEIKISQIRDLERFLSFKPYLSSFKTAIIDKAHCLNQEAQSAFLKTLEEPRGETILILVSHLPQVLFPTILSRVQKIRFSPVALVEINDYLKRMKTPEENIKELVSLSTV